MRACPQMVGRTRIAWWMSVLADSAALRSRAKYQAEHHPTAVALRRHGRIHGHQVAHNLVPRVSQFTLAVMMRCHGVAHGHEVCKTYKLAKIKMARLQSVQLIAMSYQPATQNKIGSFGTWDHSLFSSPAFFI